MNTKVLQLTTIVPSELYVERSADRQVYKVIEEMGRPGYVLVARQMGKTNLLLNAKRKLEGNNDLFVYIDLSNSYDTSKQRFRSFIDTAIEVGSHLLGDVSAEIYNERIHNDLPAHIEHTRELRKILKKISGKLVIILDEVDSLTKSDYSDEIFAQIRSIYFSRVNFPETNRLTYLLSGVAEPTELIKNTKISPFNIGEKIYLDDFSVDEFNNFIKIAKLDISTDVHDRIYYWTNGNPRMTWDVCSDIEDRFIGGNNVSCVDVDNTIFKLYLTNFDRPPIDHIRTLIEKEKELRNAVTEIRYNKSDSISDSIKTKLYLAGITNINSIDRQVFIKNKIIDMSLSKEYLESVDLLGKKSFNIAQEMYINNNYAEAIKYYKISLDDSLITERTRDEIHFSIGTCYYKLYEYDNAIDYLSKIDLSRGKKTNQYFGINFYLGMSYFYLDNQKMAYSYYNNVISGNMYDWVYFSSLISLGSVVQRINNGDITRSDEIYNRALIELDEHSSNFDSDEYNNFVSVINYNLATSYHSKGNVELSEKYSMIALNLVGDNAKLKVYSLLLKLCAGDHGKYLSYAENILPIINSTETVKLSKQGYLLEFDFEGLMSISLFSFLNNDLTLHNKTIEIFKRSEENEFNAADYYYALANYASKLNLNSDAVCLYKYILEEILSNDNLSVYHYAITKGLISSGIGDYHVNGKHIFDLYVDTFGNCVEYVDCDVVDLKLLSHILFQFVVTDKSKSNKILSIAESIIKSSNGKYDINYSWIYFSKMVMSKEFGHVNEELEYAKKYITFYENKVNFDISNSVLKKEDLDKIANTSYNLVNISKVPQIPFISNKKYGRNDIVLVEYVSGKRVYNKYKRLEDDIRTGKCKLVVENKKEFWT